ADGDTGRKGKGGFYRLNKTADGKKTKETLDLKTGQYRAEKTSRLESAEAAKAGLAALVSHPDIGGQFAKRVLVQTLHYTASLVPEISDDILGIDEAMRLGYNWKYGPFELIDRLSMKGKAFGSDLLAAACLEVGLSVPPIVSAASGKTFYKEEGTQKFYLSFSSSEAEKPSPSGRGLGEGMAAPNAEASAAETALTPCPLPEGEGAYLPLPTPEGVLKLADVKRGKQPVSKNGSAALWDLGDGIAGFELTTKANTFDNDVLSLLQKSVEIVKKDFRGLVIGTDAADFSFGANLGFFMYVANLAAWPMLSGIIKQGHDAFMGLKYAPFPVVTALAGRALGGGCELNLHADAVQAHTESYPGLVEVGVGIIPGWGGCKEMLWRHLAVASQESLVASDSSSRVTTHDLRLPAGPMPAISKVFEAIATARVAMSAQEAQDMGILNALSHITPNRNRLLADAKQLCLSLSTNYAPPTTHTVRLPGATGKAALMMALDGYQASGKATPHDRVVGEALATVLTGGGTDITEETSEQQLLTLEHDLFMELVKLKATQARIEHMLEFSKPLRN
ncbi:MAG: enoyl-CoA hydratase/isomerase family protein, partial [Rickettsiales bacterium]|nr:enoyl-CoA hydratase/isomerase family protein [Rickettsiales bacterium]